MTPHRCFSALAVLLWLGCATGSSSEGEDDGGTSGGDVDADPSAPDAPPGGPADAAPGVDAVPIGTPCDPVAQTGCSASQKCAWIVSDVATQAGAAGCYPNGTRSAGATCELPDEVNTADDCVRGTHCVFGTCHEMCTSTPASTCSTGGCVPVEGLEFDICLPNCDVLVQNCPIGDACYLTDAGPVCADVVGAGVDEGDTCMFLNDCKPGMGCFNDPPVCMKYCERANPVQCATGQTCAAIAGEPVIGVCNPPQ